MHFETFVLLNLLIRFENYEMNDEWCWRTLGRAKCKANELMQTAAEEIKL